jgi:hypothetical protein
MMSRFTLASLLVLALAIPARASPETAARPEGCDADATGGRCRGLLDHYRWLTADAHVERLNDRIPPPRGAHRVAVAGDSFGAWLRGLPVRAPGTPVRSFRGELLHDGNDRRIAAVVELDVGSRDLQQCADSIMRLDAEWRYAAGRGDEIAYPLGHHQQLAWKPWALGQRPVVGDDDHVSWTRRARPDDSHAALRAYLDVVFIWAGTASLADATRPVPRAELRAGDFFIVGGHPGHAVLVLDVAEDDRGHRWALIGQGFMPAQDFHVLAHEGDPWFSLDGDSVQTPFWPAFRWSALRRLP